MARSTQDIKALMVADFQANEVLTEKLTSPSLTAIYNLWFYIIASCINLLEQFQDLFISDVQAELDARPSYNIQWLQDQIKNWQYGYTIAVQSDFQLRYPTNDDSAKLVTRMCLIPGPTFGVSEVRVSKETDPPVSLSGAEITSLENYLLEVMPPGMNAPTVSTAECDQVTVQLKVYYNTEFYQTIQEDTFAALKAYFNQPEDGKIFVDDLITVLNGVPGMVRFDLIEVAVRLDGDPYPSATIIYSQVPGSNIQGNIPGEWDTSNGAAVEEVTATHTWTDTIEFSAVQQ